MYDLLVQALGGHASPVGLTHRPGPWAFSFGTQGGREGGRQGGNPRSRVVGCSGGSAGHCPGPRAALLLPEGEPGPEKGRGSGPGQAGDTCEWERVPRETSSCSLLLGPPVPSLECSPTPAPLPFPFQEALLTLGLRQVPFGHVQSHRTFLLERLWLGIDSGCWNNDHGHLHFTGSSQGRD